MFDWKSVQIQAENVWNVWYKNAPIFEINFSLLASFTTKAFKKTESNIIVHFLKPEQRKLWRLLECSRVDLTYSTYS